MKRRALPSEKYIPRLCTCGSTPTGAAGQDQPYLVRMGKVHTTGGQIGHILRFLRMHHTSRSLICINADGIALG